MSESTAGWRAHRSAGPSWPRYSDVKDPCLVHDGREWHLYGSGIVGLYRYEILHATSQSLDGEWTLQPPPELPLTLDGNCVAAPGVIVEGGLQHMFLQTEYNVFDGRLEHLVSSDAGRSFAHAGTALVSLAGSDEAGIYDPHPAEIHGERYLVYSAFAVVGEPDLHLARSTSGRWEGPWERLGPLLRHQDVPFHNVRGSDRYEWGLEGGQLLELPDGRILLNAVCFLDDGVPGSRQRVFFGIASEVLGGYRLTGPILTPTAAAMGENGHACAVVDGGGVVVFFQERHGAVGPWGFGMARIPVEELDPGLRRAA